MSRAGKRLTRREARSKNGDKRSQGAIFKVFLNFNRDLIQFLNYILQISLPYQIEQCHFEHSNIPLFPFILIEIDRDNDFFRLERFIRAYRIFFLPHEYIL